METKEVKNLIRNIYNAFEKGNENDLDQYIDQKMVEHTQDPFIQTKNKGLDYAKEQIRTYHTAFPDMKFEIKEVFVEGDKAIVYASVRGTNSGELNGTPATNKKVTLDICEMFMIRNNKVAEHWQIVDNLSFVTQLGILSESELKTKLSQGVGKRS